MASLSKSVSDRGSNKAVTYDDCCKYWRSLNLSTEKDYSIELENFRVVFIDNSLKIDGIDVGYHNVRLVADKGRVASYTGDIESLVAVKNYSQLWTLMLGNAVAQVKLSIKILSACHCVLMHDLYSAEMTANGETPGMFKVNDYCYSSSGIGARADEVVELIGEIINKANCFRSDDACDVLEMAVSFYAKLETICPYADGNGRMGRLLMNYLLIANKHPPIVIHSDDIDVYYKSIDLYKRTNNISALLTFMREQLVKTFKNRIRR